jgi:muconolactone delta-isomerase
MTEEDMDQWMMENELWTLHDDKKEEGLKKDIERLKVEIYNARDNAMLASNLRKYIRAGEAQITSHLNKKYIYHQNTCEGIASSERLAWIIKNTTYFNGKLYNFEELSLQYVVDEWQSHFISESKSRELARNDPWKSLWVTRESSGFTLFANPPNTELTYNQKNILIWSQMYDNIQESMECPNKEVIEDDDMLDGWFIIQHKKREKDRVEKEFENSTKNEKIKNAPEVFVVASKEKAEKINDMNDMNAKMIKHQRKLALDRYGSLDEQNLPDQRRNIQAMANNQNRGK